MAADAVSPNRSPLGFSLLSGRISGRWRDFRTPFCLLTPKIVENAEGFVEISRITEQGELFPHQGADIAPSASAP
jgi:hypothetical protein